MKTKYRQPKGFATEDYIMHGDGKHKFWDDDLGMGMAVTDSGYGCVVYLDAKSRPYKVNFFRCIDGHLRMNLEPCKGGNYTRQLDLTELVYGGKEGEHETTTTDHEAD